MELKRRCKNMTQANKYVANTLKKIKDGEIVDDIIIIELVKYHPTKKIDVDNVEWFKMQKRPPYNTLALFYKYKNSENEDDISWKLCIRNLYGKHDKNKEHKNDIRSAFRTESHFGTKQQFHNNNTVIINNKFVGICNNCNIQTDNIATDHHNLSYKQIFDDFIKINKIKLHEIDIFEDENNMIRIKDKKLARKWLKYHDSRAVYRLLCNSCNCSFGSYGYT